MDDPVLLTGAGGYVGEAILSGIGEEYDWRLLYHNPPDEPPDHEYLVGEVQDDELMREAVEGVTAVIHLAGDPRPDAPWDSVLEHNIDGTQTLYQAAVDANVEKFVYASSNHAVGHFETDRTPGVYRPSGKLVLDGSELPRPGNFYGVSKVACEFLGRYYHDEYGIRVVNVRIGNLTKNHPPRDYERGQAMWLSYRDCAHLFDCCLEASFEFEVIYGISDNDRKFYSLDRAREIFGYQPQDNSGNYD